MTEISVLDGTNATGILAAARILRDGGVAVVPTDTVYGLAASVLRPEAVARVFEIKRRPPEMPVPVLLATAADLPILVRDVPRIAWKLIERFWPGSLTLVMPARRSVPKLITAGGETVAVRVPGGRGVLRLLETLGEPIVGTSANISGQPAIVRGADAIEQLAGIDAVLIDDTGIGGLPSTVVDISQPMPIIVRVGAVSTEEIREVIGARVHVQEQLIAPPPPR